MPDAPAEQRWVESFEATIGGVWSVTNADVVLVVPTAAAPTAPGRRRAVDVEAEHSSPPAPRW